MLSRTSHEQKGTRLPEKWENQTRQLLESAFKGKYNSDKSGFYIFGQTFPDELFIAISFLDHDAQTAIPTTYCSSCEIKTAQNYDKLVDHMTDAAGIFFDTYFGDPNWDDYCSNWTPFNYKGIKLHYKITRENIELTLKADELLAD